MRTAEEIQRSLKETIENHMQADDRGNLCLFEGGEVDDALPALLVIVKEIISEACREQREICADVYAQGAFYANPKLEEKISNAPSPEMK